MSFIGSVPTQEFFSWKGASPTYPPLGVRLYTYATDAGGCVLKIETTGGDFYTVLSRRDLYDLATKLQSAYRVGSNQPPETT